MREITVTEGLRELKLYDAKINKAINKANLVIAAKKSEDILKQIGKTKKEFKDEAKAEYISIKDLIENRAKLKAAIVNSNAKTKVTIDGVKMTVAEAIERKSSIEYEQTLLKKLKSAYEKANDLVSYNNDKVDNKVDELIKTMVGKDTSKMSKDDQDKITNGYRENNEWDIVDPIEIRKEIDKLEERIDGFLANVDVQLSLSNSTTFIKLED